MTELAAVSAAKSRPPSCRSWRYSYRASQCLMRPLMTRSVNLHPILDAVRHGKFAVWRRSVPRGTVTRAARYACGLVIKVRFLRVVQVGRTGKYGRCTMPAVANHSSFDVHGFLTRQKAGCVELKYRSNQLLYSQDTPADSVFYIHKGRVRVIVISERGKEAVVAIRGPDEFCGEGAVTGKPLRLSSVIALTACEAVRIEVKTLTSLLHNAPQFADYFLFHLLTRTARVEADLVDQLFNSSEMRLARALLLLANYGNDASPEPLSLKVNQEILADLIGTTRSRVNLFMNKFRRLGLIEYNGHLRIHKALLNFVLHEKPHIEPKIARRSH